MEPDEEELVKAREALRQELATLNRISGRWHATDPLPIIAKLRGQIREIDALLGSGEADDAGGKPKDRKSSGDLRCIGCAKSSHDVRMLLAGADWAICDECLSFLVAMAAQSSREWRNEQIKALEEINAD